MFKFSTTLLLVIALAGYGQDDPSDLAKPIVDEGKKLYKSEMASWYGTDVFLAEYKEKGDIGGYFSYVEGGFAKCIFFSKSNEPKVIGTITFDSLYDVSTAKKDLEQRDFTIVESGMYAIRKIALTTVNSDSLFKTYQNTSLNVVPLIDELGKRVYVLTGPKQNGVIIFGNDYLLSFDDHNTLVGKKQLHKNIIPINFGGTEEEGKEVEATIHSHLPETGDFITATDICTLMLYEKFTKWKQHNVVSKNYLNIWDCKKDQLAIISMSVVKKINADQQKRKKRRSKQQ